VPTACLAACSKRPDVSELRWTPVDLVPAAEISDLGDSDLSTPYAAWALAARHRQRAFVFWTYVIALAEDPLLKQTAEAFAQEALSDGNRLRHERRTAWRAERKIAAEETAASGGIDEPASAALLESLLFKDIMAWSQELDPARREQLFTLGIAPLSPSFLTPLGGENADMEHGGLEQIKRRTLRRAEQLSNLYLDEADRAADQNSLELAQKLAQRSILRLAGLRQFASGSELR
jgi:hypothetical protein